MAASKKSFDLADEVHDKTAEIFASNLAAATPVTEPTHVSGEVNVVYRLKDTTKNGRVHIDGCADAWNPKLNGGKGRMDRIWLLTGTQTIWQSELGDIIKDKDFIRANKRMITFEGRVLRVPSYDTLMIEFLENSPHYMGNPNNKTISKTPFYKWDPVAQQKAAMAKEMLGVQMVVEANKQPLEKMRRHAFYLGIPMNDEMGIPKTEDGIRLDYMRYANSNPEQFRNSLGSKEVDVKYLVRRAILDAKIDIGSGHGRMAWAKTGGYICSVPQGMEATAYMTELALSTSDEGKAFLEQLQENVK